MYRPDIHFTLDVINIFVLVNKIPQTSLSHNSSEKMYIKEISGRSTKRPLHLPRQCQVNRPWTKNTTHFFCKYICIKQPFTYDLPFLLHSLQCGSTTKEKTYKLPNTHSSSRLFSNKKIFSRSTRQLPSRKRKPEQYLFSKFYYCVELLYMETVERNLSHFLAHIGWISSSCKYGCVSILDGDQRSKHVVYCKTLK
jgi:hypothetical protein